MPGSVLTSFLNLLMALVSPLSVYNNKQFSELVVHFHLKKTYLALVSVDQREKPLMFFCQINLSSGVLVQILRGHCLVCEYVYPPVTSIHVLGCMCTF